MSAYTVAMRGLQREIGRYEDALSRCSRLRSQNGEVGSALGGLAGAVVSAVKFEDPGSVQQRISRLNRDNEALISQIEQAIRDGMAECESEYRRYSRLEEERARRERLEEGR